MERDFYQFDKAYNEDVKNKIAASQSRQAKLERKREKGLTLAIIFTVIICLWVLVNIIKGYILIDKMKYENNLLSSKIETLNEEINDIRIKIDEKTQTGLVEQIAVNQLGLERPKLSQITVLNQTKEYALKNSPLDDKIKPEVALGN